MKHCYIYKIFEYNEIDNPSEITRSKFTIIENMTSENSRNLNEETTSISREPKEIRLLSYKILVEKFNSKYEDLSAQQKSVLREYIGNISNTNNLKTFLQTESKRVKKVLVEKMKGVKDKSLVIKLNEVVGLLDEYDSIKNIGENHVLALMRYYDLINDL